MTRLPAAASSAAFQSTRPARGATHDGRRLQHTVCLFQSTRPARGATSKFEALAHRVPISIHAPREGRDVLVRQFAPLDGRISIHAPREGRDSMRPSIASRRRLFQSTRPARGATGDGSSGCSVQRNFNPRAPRGARPSRLIGNFSLLYFNPRAPRGARLFRGVYRRPIAAFQSTRPARGATVVYQLPIYYPVISIHAPREGRDEMLLKSSHRPQLFQSTRPARGATGTGQGLERGRQYFNPRAPRGARPSLAVRLWTLINFNPRAPRGARPYGGVVQW